MHCARENVYLILFQSIIIHLIVLLCSVCIQFLSSNWKHVLIQCSYIWGILWTYRDRVLCTVTGPSHDLVILVFHVVSLCSHSRVRRITLCSIWCRCVVTSFHSDTFTQWFLYMNVGKGVKQEDLQTLEVKNVDKATSLYSVNINLSL